ncbi:UvrD-helicase domain-containing protein [Rheinheimera sp. WS51]|uniref:UvrD-helicase domain-containing protein n=1 Tax=Rheinheimera sp. WS51 TaxID=3425886 RepID=UPI003D90BD04
MLIKPPIDEPNRAFALTSLFNNEFLNDFFKKNKLTNAIKTAHQRKINACTTVPQFQHVNNTAQVIDVITNHNIAIEQEQLLANYVQNISAELVDIDYLTLAVDLTEKDICSFLSKEDGIFKVKTKNRNSHLTVTSLAAKNKNKGFKEGDTKPFFTRCFELKVDGDAYKYVNIYFADKSHPRNLGRPLPHNLEIEFIPSRFAPGMIDLVFSHLKSVLKANRYPQLMNNSRVLRVDLGMNMFGVSQLFCFIDTINKKVSAGSCYPEDQNCLAMTTNLGSEDNSRASVYDKLAKELTKQFEEVVVGLQENINDLLEEIGGYDKAFSELLPIARYEFKHEDEFYLTEDNKSGNGKKVTLRLHQLALLKPEFGNTIFVKPSALQHVSPRTLKKLVRDKSVDEMKKLRELFNAEDAYLKLDEEKVLAAFLPHLTQLQSSILTPQKVGFISNFNYTQVVNEARDSLVPFQEILHERCSDQDEIITSDVQNIYVEGTPGSGKTTTMIKRVCYLIEQKKAEPEEICVLAFTKKAANHFKKQLLKKCPDAERVSVSTFSRWCNQTVTKFNFLTVLSADDSEALINRFINRVGNQEICSSASLRKKVVRVINHSTNFVKPHIPTSIKKLAPELVDYEKSVCRVFRLYRKHKEDRRLQDFNDILLNMKTMLDDTGNAKFLAQQLKYIFVDEAQDSSEVQWEILKSLSRQKANIFCVGDPAQSIYGFRGAKVAALENFTMMFHNAKKFALRKCYRSNHGIVNFCNAIRQGISGTLTLAISQDKSQYLPRLKPFADFTQAKAELLRDLKKIKELNSNPSVLVLSNYKKIITELKEAADEISSGMAIIFTNTHQGKGLEADITLIFDTSLGNGKLSTRKQEMCNLYVACSRAKRSLKVFYNPNRLPYYDTSKGQSKKASVINILHDIHHSLYK